MTTRLPSLLRPPIGFAHRGASAHAPENTLAAFELAVELGATGLETDAWLTADGCVVLDHDGLVGGRFRRRPVSEIDRHRLPEHVPTLDELYGRVGGRWPLSVDIKDPATFGPLIDVARHHGAEDALWICHPDLDLLTEWRRRTSARLVHSTRLRRLADGPERHAAVLRERGIDAVNFRQGDWTGGLIALFHRFDRLALGWDAQQPREIAQLLDGGIDGIFSDHADRLSSALDQAAGRGR